MNMIGIKEKSRYSVKKEFLTDYLHEYWYIPSDVLQRSIEANVWDHCEFRAPVLDIGVGNGKITSFIFKHHKPMAMGIDNEDSQLQTARETGRYKQVLCVDAAQMPFADGAFSTVVSNSTFEHISRDKKAVSEVGRVLKKGGLFYLTVPNKNLEQWIYEYETEKNAKTAKENVKKFNTRANHLHYRTLEEWKDIFSNSNMELIFHKYYFPKEIARLWYKLFLLYTKTFRGREAWSYLEHSKITPFIPKPLVRTLLKSAFLESAYKKAFFTTREPGAQLFMVARKKG